MPSSDDASSAASMMSEEEESMVLFPSLFSCCCCCCCMRGSLETAGARKSYAYSRSRERARGRKWGRREGNGGENRRLSAYERFFFLLCFTLSLFHLSLRRGDLRRPAPGVNHHGHQPSAAAAAARSPLGRGERGRSRRRRDGGGREEARLPCRRARQQSGSRAHPQGRRHGEVLCSASAPAPGDEGRGRCRRDEGEDEGGRASSCF